MTSAAEDLTAVRQRVERAAALLADASPPALGRGAEELEQAVRQLTSFREGLPPGPGGAPARYQAECLRMAVRHATRLLQGSADFFNGWNRRRGELMCGYTAQGDAAAVPCTGHLSLQG
jgi:hypothetical protein